jgi:hypothetical protein
MYCKHCGKEIADDSKFCQYCGAPQKEEHHNILTKFNNINLSYKAKFLIVVYGLWVLLNLYWFITGNWYSGRYDYFFPFDADDCGCYDLSEFIVYVFGLPLLIYGIRLIYNHRKEIATDMNIHQ